jgi:hypothetical protein
MVISKAVSVAMKASLRKPKKAEAAAVAAAAASVEVVDLQVLTILL